MNIEIDRSELISVISTITIKSANLTKNANRFKSEKKREQTQDLANYYNEIRRKLVEQLENNEVGA